MRDLPLDAGASALLWLLVFSLVVTSAIGLFYYLRVIVVLYSHVPEPVAATTPLSEAGSLSLAWKFSALTAVVIALGCYPSPILRFIQTMIVGSG
jgi:NADH-quinone oxidoreductase subunit N